MRPDVNAGPIERSLSPLNVGVDIGSRGVGEASGLGVALAVGDEPGDACGVGDGDDWGLDGSCATTPNDIIRVRTRDKAHEDMVINDSFGCDRDGAFVETGAIRRRRWLISAQGCFNPGLKSTHSFKL